MAKALTGKQPNWRQGACQQGEGTDPEVFFPDDKLVDVPPDAAAYCSICEICVDCLDWAMKNDLYGVWGNTTHEQRKKLKRGINRVHCPGCSSVDILEWIGDVEICLACGLSWAI